MATVTWKLYPYPRYSIH